MTLEPQDLEDLKDAVEALEDPGLAIQIANVLGEPIEFTVKRLPDVVSRSINEATEAALKAALHMAVATMRKEQGLRPSTRMHRFLSSLSGAVGGAFGLPAFSIELPVSTTIMLRSIADIARSEGEDLKSADARVACIEVFALGSKTQADASSKTAYYATRTALARAVAEAAQFIAQKGLVEEGAPAIVKLIAKVAARFSISVSQKFAAQSIPAIGAAGGAAINLLFISHYQEMARGHFTVRRLERKYGEDVVRREYERISQGIEGDQGDVINITPEPVKDSADRETTN